MNSSPSSPPETRARSTGSRWRRCGPCRTYDWPGNIRELRNIIERAIALCLGREIQLEDLPEQFQHNKPATAMHRGVQSRSPRPTHLPVPTLARTKDDAERFRITDALRRHQNNRLRAAAELGISRMTLYKKLHKYGMMGTA